jgi:hypothetical protein
MGLFPFEEEKMKKLVMLLVTVSIAVSAFGQKKPKIDYSKIRVFIFTNQGNSGFVDEDLKRRTKAVETVRDLASTGARKFGGRVDTTDNMTLADSPAVANIMVEIIGASMEDTGETKTDRSTGNIDIFTGRRADETKKVLRPVITAVLTVPGSDYTMDWKVVGDTFDNAAATLTYDKLKKWVKDNYDRLPH